MLQLIPLPYYAQEKSGVFAIDAHLKVNSDFELKLLNLERSQDGKLKIKKDSSLDDEEYKLEVTNNEINVSASSEKGAYYALQTLRQLGRFELGGKEIPCCVINDKPRFSWRGLQLDESRHFFGKEYVKKMLDMMFMMKLNVFHWHLTDDKIIRIIKMKIKIKRLFEVITKRVDFVNLDVKINIFKGFEIYNNSDKIACFEFDEMWAVLMLGTQFFCALVYSLCIKYSIEKY